MDVLTFAMGAVVGLGGLAAGTIKDLLTRHFQLKDKQGERHTARQDSHQNNLREAYVEFISEYRRLLTLGGEWILILQSMDNRANNVYDKEVRERKWDVEMMREAGNDPALAKRSLEKMEEFVRASVEVNRKAVAVVLLEEDGELSLKMQTFLAERIRFPQVTREYTQLASDLKECNARIEALTLSLAGRFAPKSPPSAAKKRPLFAAKNNKAPESGVGRALMLRK